MCEDGIAASVRVGRSCGNAILPDGPAFVYFERTTITARPTNSRKVQGQKLRGHYAYYGLPGNGEALQRLRYEVTRVWRTWLLRPG